VVPPVIGNDWRPKTEVPDSCVKVMLHLSGDTPKPLLPSFAAMVMLRAIGPEVVLTDCGAMLKLSSLGESISASATLANNPNASAAPVSTGRKAAIQ